MLTTITTTAEMQQELQYIGDRLASLTAEQLLLESHRDTLIRQLADSEGLHDRHPVAVR
jgi:hypothetical protein